jgi:hypothetical protein
METADAVLSRVARSDESVVLPWALKYLAK